jgi:hypothetical protein
VFLLLLAAVLLLLLLLLPLLLYSILAPDLTTAVAPSATAW